MVDNVFCVANRITGDKIVNINKFFINHNGVKSEFIIAINMLWIEFRLLFICKYLERGECKITKKMNTKKVFHNKYGMSNVWGIERSGFFNGREKWAKGFENQRV